MSQNIKPSEISDVLLRQLKEIRNELKFEEIGEVLQVSDGVVRIFGLDNAEANELIEFENGIMAVVMNLEEDNVGAVLLGPTDQIKEGMTVKRTDRIASIDVGEGMIGRVVDPLGTPLDGRGAIEGETLEMPLERKAPGVIFRQPVTQPLQTGLKSIDAMIPIGKGQRELIIGDRQTGKTAIAIDTIINQRESYVAGNPVYCIYVAVGQKASTVASIVNTLRQKGAMDYTIVVAATAADPAAMQYYAPFAGAAIGEYFRDTGRHALVVYDDLSKQAVAYREVSLILKRPSGREAYPGDIFYLHSRLLERAAKIIDQQEVAEKMNDLPDSLKGKVKCGGSLTALPIIETQAGDVSAYIPTNVISITDGQIFLDTDLFNQGFRPAINVGISVSRVGGSAQVKSMKKVAGTLKIDQAQYRELEAFSKFSSDMDPVTAMSIDKGRKNNELLIQPQYSPMPVGDQVAILYCGTHALIDTHAAGRDTHCTRDVEVFRPRRRFGIILHHIGQQRGVRHTVRRIVEGAQRMRHRVYDPQPDIREAHAGNILRFGHTGAGRFVGTVFDGIAQMAGDQFDGLQFEHVAHGPCAGCDISFDGVRQRIHSRCSREPPGHRIHQFAIDDRTHRDVVRIDADHLAARLLVRNDIVDRHLGRRTRCRGNGKGRHGTMARGRRTFERTHIGKFGIVDDDAHRLGRVDRRTAAQRHHEIGPRSLERLDTLLHVADRGIRLDLAVNLIGDSRFGEHLFDFGRHTETDQLLVRYQQRLAEAAFAGLPGNRTAASGTVVRGFIQYDSVHGRYRLEVTSASYRSTSGMNSSPTGTSLRRQNMSQTAFHGSDFDSSSSASRSKP